MTTIISQANSTRNNNCFLSFPIIKSLSSFTVPIYHHPNEKNNNTSFFPQHPLDIWHRIQLYNAAHWSFDQLLDTIVTSKSLSSFRPRQKKHVSTETNHPPPPQCHSRPCFLHSFLGSIFQSHLLLCYYFIGISVMNFYRTLHCDI
jgi:hypothetical protein